MNKQLIILIVLFIAVLILFYNKQEHAGALMQLYAKGPQDYYLTGDTDYYIPYYYPPPYMYFWNQPTRFRHNGAPYLLLTPDSRFLY